MARLPGPRKPGSPVGLSRRPPAEHLAPRASPAVAGNAILRADEAVLLLGPRLFGLDWIAELTAREWYLLDKYLGFRPKPGRELASLPDPRAVIKSQHLWNELREAQRRWGSAALQRQYARDWLKDRELVERHPGEGEVVHREEFDTAIAALPDTLIKSEGLQLESAGRKQTQGPKRPLKGKVDAFVREFAAQEAEQGRSLSEARLLAAAETGLSGATRQQLRDARQQVEPPKMGRPRKSPK